MIKYLFLFLLFVCTHPVWGQTNRITDTLEYARTRAYAKRFAEADELLTQYTSNKKDINALRLHAQVLYWMKAFGRSEEVYRKALALFPEVHVVKLDYARMLFELNKLQQAEVLLNNYLPYDDRHAEANMLLTYIDLWKGNGRSARNRSERLRQWYPDNKQILELATTVFDQTGLTIRANATYFSDDQPLTNKAYELEAGSMYSSLVSPTVRLRLNNFGVGAIDNATQWVQVGNTMVVGYTGLTIQAAAGAFHYQGSRESTTSATAGQSGTQFTANLQLTQKVAPSFYLELGVDRSPYQFTIASIQTPLLQTAYKAGLRFNKSDKWLGRASYEVQQFDRAERIETASVWLLAPLLTHKRINLSVGYSFTYTNASQNTYRATLPINSIIANFGQTTAIKGVYDPYFSPRNQIVNAILASVRLTVRKGIEVIGRANVGAYATADNPFLYLDKATADQLIISKSYQNQQYNPATYVGEVRVRCSKHINISGHYGYSRLFFYTSNQGGLDLAYRF